MDVLWESELAAPSSGFDMRRFYACHVWPLGPRPVRRLEAIFASEALWLDAFRLK